MTSRRTSSMFFRGLAAAFLLACLPLTSLAEDGPMVLGRRQRGPILTLDPFSGSLGFSGIYEYSKAAGNAGNSNTTDILLQEQLSLATSGSVISRSFLDWHASATIGLDEEWSTDTGSKRSTVDQLLEYDLGANLFGTTKFPTQLYAQQTQSYITRSFGPLLRNNATLYGTTINYQSSVLPTSLRIAHLGLEQTDLGGVGQYTLDQDILEFATSYHPIDSQTLSLNYTYNGVNQSGEGSVNNDYQLQNVVASHNWRIDPAGLYSLAESINYAAQVGGFPYTDLRFTEQLRMRPFENFDSNLSYTYNQQTYPASSSTSNEINGTCSYQLFESLATHGRAFYMTTDNSFPGSNSNAQQWGGDLLFNYTKKVPFGVFGANLSVGYTQNVNGPTGSSQQVQNDLATFNDPLPIILTQPGVSASSLAVFNASRTRQFVEGTDYTVSTAGNTVQIQRVIGGNIAPNQTVSLNYDILPLPGYTSVTTDFGIGCRYDFREGPLTGLSLFVQYLQQDQTISSGGQGFIVPDNIRDLLLGSEYTIWKITFSGGYEDHNSTLAPYQALRFAARYADRISDRTVISIALSQAFITYPSTNDQTDYTNLNASLDYQISRDLYATISTLMRNQDDTIFGHTMGFETQANLRWRIRQTELYMGLRHTYLTAPGSDSQTLSFQFGITRNF